MHSTTLGAHANPDDAPMHCIAVGEGAIANLPYQFSLRVRLVPGEEPVQGSTIMTHEEWEVVARVIRRVAQDCMRQLEQVPPHP